jgi:hypothetical protein
VLTRHPEAGEPKSGREMRIRNAALLVPLCIAIISLLFTSVPAFAHAQPSNMPPIVQTKLAGQHVEESTAKVQDPPPRGMPLASSLGTSYDEQLGTTFTQDFTSMLYYVTAVAQTDPTSGTGPAYLLNGLSNTGYWYQVGLSWNWNPGYTPGTGFGMSYEVFDPSGNSILPTNGGGGLLSFSGPVNQGDSVALNLYFTNSGQVVMLAKDQNTGAYASETYSAEGATFFEGSPYSTANSNGFFTGLMTEWYHSSPYYSNEQKVTYSSSFALSSAWMWIDEFSCSGISCSNTTALFSDSTTSPISYSNPTQLQEFSSNGATEYSDAYEFITGSLSEVTMTLSYSVIGGGSGFGAPVFTYVSNGVQQTAILSTAPSSYLVDINTAWSVTDPLSGSSSNERWQASQQTSGVAMSSQTIVFQYYHQYQVEFGYQSGSGGSPPQIAYYEFGVEQSTTPSTLVWADAGSQYQYQNPLQGSTSSERWYSQDASGTVSSSAQITVLYYHQYAVKVSYSVIGGGSNLVPTLTSTSFGATSTQDVPSSGEVLWLDAGSGYVLNNPVTSGAERLYTNGVTSGMVTQGLVLSPAYYNQYLVTLSYSILGGGGGYSPPVFTYIASGATASAPLLATQSSYWVDSGSQWSMSNPLPGSTSLERWETNSSTDYMVSSPGTYSFTYFHQYFVTFAYSVRGGGTGYSPPTVNFTSFARPLTAVADASVWVDYGTSYSYPSILGGSTNTERWVATPIRSGGVVPHLAAMVVYQHQFYIIVRSAEPAGGTVSPSGGWYNASQTLTLAASPSQGWRLENWLGPYSGNANSTTLTVDSPINETAVFYPGVLIRVSSGGYVVYSYGNASGTVQPGTPATVYVPVGTNVSLSTHPLLFVYSFEGWSGLTSSKSVRVSIIVSSPTSIKANYGYNYLVIGSLSGSVVVAVAVAFLYLAKRRKGPARG